LLFSEADENAYRIRKGSLFHALPAPLGATPAVLDNNWTLFPLRGKQL
jgi:hypothetical protein